ncbi:MAG: glycosyltransferase family 2 protein [Kiritimatiellae bacterium]|nr:glycosyltransferase family 2 protein [Kiritimatiellia bacterium]
MKLSVVIPVYNEMATLPRILEAVERVELPVDRELVLVDDGSTDGGRAFLEQKRNERPDWKIVLHEANSGKGRALRDGFKAATGEVVIVQDADLEYDPAEYALLLAPILAGHADVVFGSRFLGGGPHRVVFFWHYVGNRLITTLSNMFTNLNLTDVEVCYKMFRKEVLDSIELKEDRFGFEIEVTAKVARAGWRIYEVPVSYYGRTYAEGKKITWRDGWRALWCIFKYRFCR